MKTRHFFIAAAAALAFTSCTKESALVNSSNHAQVPVELTASSEDTKATIDKFSNLWSTGDKIAVFDGVCTEAHEFTLQSGAGTAAGSFSGTACAGYASLSVATPFSAVSSIESGSIKMTLPETQTAEGSCDPKALLGVGVSSAGKVALKNVGSVVRFSISDTNIKKVTVSGNDSEKIAGTISVNPETAAVVISEGKTSVDFVPKSTTFAAGTYEIVLLPAELTKGVTVTVTNAADQSKTRSTANALSLARNSIINLGDVCNGFVFSETSKSFNYGETLTFDVCVDGISGISVAAITDGWVADLSQIASGKVSITAPAEGATQPKGAVVLKGTNSKSAEVKTNTLALRFYGINDKADLLAFRKAHGGTDTEHQVLIKDADAYAKSIAPFKVGEWVTFNADIEAIKGDEFTNSYCNFMHHINEKIDGKNHTINLDVNGMNKSTMLTFFQHIDVDVKNLNFAGQMTQTTKDAAQFASVAVQITKSATVENVNSSVNLTTTKKNCTIGGILALCTGADATLKDCTYNGTIKPGDAPKWIGGISGCQSSGKGTYVATVDGCKFEGKIDYSTTDNFANVRIGGIMGGQERNSVIKNCTNSGEIVFNLKNTKILPTAGTGGIGGICGRCTAIQSGYTMSTVIKDCSFTGKIIFNETNPDQPKVDINQIIGKKNSGYQEDQSTGNVESGEIKYNYPDPVGSISFNDATPLSFAYGETKTIEITTDRMSTLEAVTAPKGWTLDFSSWKSGTITVKAPSSGKGNEFEGAIDLSLQGKDETSITAYSSNTKTIRLYGINNATELAAFSAAYGNSSDSPVTGDAIKPYLVDNEITLNADISIPSAQIVSTAYWLKNLVLPLNGNEHTLTFSTSKGHRGGLIQNLKANVHDLNLAGKIAAVNPGNNDTYIGALACVIYVSGLEIKNINSSVEISLSGTETDGKKNFIGGIVGGVNANNYTVNIVNCSVTGKMSYSIKNTTYMGGIFGYARTGEPGSVTNISGCTHSGAMDVTMLGANDIRVGGIVGNSERKAVLTSCTNSGNLTVDCAGFAFSTKNGEGACGLGGLISRQGKPATDCDMTCTITDCTNSGTITLKNAVENEFNVESSGTTGCVGQFVGKNCNSTTYSEVGTCTKSGSVVIEYVAN